MFPTTTHASTVGFENLLEVYDVFNRFALTRASSSIYYHGSKRTFDFGIMIKLHTYDLMDLLQCGIHLVDTVGFQLARDIELRHPSCRSQRRAAAVAIRLHSHRGHHRRVHIYQGDSRIAVRRSNNSFVHMVVGKFVCCEMLSFYAHVFSNCAPITSCHVCVPICLEYLTSNPTKQARMFCLYVFAFIARTWAPPPFC